MSAALEDITEQALKLSHQERLALAQRLLSEDDDEESSAIEATWEEEILARSRAIDSGSAVSVPYDQVVRAARDRRGLNVP
jgi:hypothetical protein